MRAAHLLPLLLGCLASGLAQAQAPSPAPAEQPARSERRVEQIQHKDAGSTIDELRVGGETKSITVKPGDAPAYDIAPDTVNRPPGNMDRERGGSGSGGGWKIKSF